MAAIVTKTFLLPGDMVSDLLGIRGADDRSMTRTLVNMLFWNLVGAFMVLAFA